MIAIGPNYRGSMMVAVPIPRPVHIANELDLGPAGPHVWTMYRQPRS